MTSKELDRHGRPYSRDRWDDVDVEYDIREATISITGSIHESEKKGNKHVTTNYGLDYTIELADPDADGQLTNAMAAIARYIENPFATEFFQSVEK